MATHLIAACGDDSFGPKVRDANCRGGFDFTLLFEESILSIVPSSLLLLLIPWRVARLYGRRIKVLPTSLSSLKLISITVYACIQLVLIILWSSSPAPKTLATTASASLNLIAALALTLLSYFEHSRSIRPSFVINIYLFASLLLDLARVRTQWLLSNHEKSIASIFTVSILLKVLILGLEASEKRRYLLSAYRNLSNESTGGIFSQLSFWWLNPLLLEGSGKVLAFDDLFAIDEALTSESIKKSLQATWDMCSNGKKNALFYTVLKTFKWPLLSVVPPRLFVIALAISQPFLVQDAIRFVSDPDIQQNTNIGYGLVGAYGLVYISIAVMTACYQHRIYRCITMIRGGLISVIYQKMVDQRVGNIAESSAITLMSTDVEQIANSLQHATDIWANFIQLGLALWLLERQLGVACIAPVLIGVAFSITTLYMGKVLVKSQKAWFEAIQKRVNITSEALDSMKGLKFSGLTDQLTGVLQGLRSKEVDISRKYRILKVINIVLSNFPGIVNPVLCFTIFALVQQARSTSPLNIEKAFTSLSILSLLTSPIFGVIYAIPELQSTLGCIHRIQEYLMRDSRQDHRLPDAFSVSAETSNTREIELRTLQNRQVTHNDATGSIVVQNGSFGWSSNQPNILEGLNVSFQRQLTLVVGPTGSGKSTLLKALLGETLSSKGFIYIFSKEIAFCDQAIWLQNKSLRDNIVGASSFDQGWYDLVIKSSALDVDFSHLILGDQTVIGSKGISLSGGQRQRLAIARAVYARKEIAIFDDVFSGLDDGTEQYVFENVFGPRGLLRREKTTVILATHAVHRLAAADYIVVLDKGQIAQQGTYKQLSSIPGYVQSLNIRNLREDILPPKLDRVDQVVAENTLATVPSPEKSDINKDHERQTGDWTIYKYYIDSIGWIRFVLFGACVAVFTVFATVLPFLWLNWWAAESPRSPVHSLGYWLGIYGLFTLLAGILCFLACYHLSLNIVTTSAKNLHRVILKAAMRAPLTFFSTTDTGTTLNRFSQDMQLVDLTLPSALTNSVFQLGSVIAMGILTSIATKYLAVVIPFICLTLFFVQRFYLRTSRQLQIMDIEAKAPLYSHFIEPLNGLVTIRAFGWSETAININTQLLDRSQKPYYLLFCIQRWLTLVLDLVVACIAIILMGLTVSLKNKISPGLLGIAMVNVMEFGQVLSLLISFWTLLETSLGGIARIRAFALNTPCEDQIDENQTPPDNWPSKGVVLFHNVSASYGPTPTSTQVLDKVTFSIQQGDKLGIVGRTGSGKSSLLLTLFRMLELSTGSILIDGLDISSIPRQEVRSRITILPQDPFFLNGTVRKNADPFERNSDEDIIAGLQKVELWTIVAEKGGLDADMHVDFLSEGQKQLFCLAKAMLRKTSILVLDEATSRVDPHADRLIQNLIRQEFKGCTIIAVAHRLDGLADFDKIVVLEKGKVVKMGRPGEVFGTFGTAEDLFLR